MHQEGNLENGKSWISDPKAEISYWTLGSSNFGFRLSVFRCRTRAFSKFPFLVHRRCVKYIDALTHEGSTWQVGSLGQAIVSCTIPIYARAPGLVICSDRGFTVRSGR